MRGALRRSSWQWKSSFPGGTDVNGIAFTSSELFDLLLEAQVEQTEEREGPRRSVAT